MKLLLFIVLIASTIISYTSASLALLFDRPDFFEEGYEEFEQKIEQFEKSYILGASQPDEGELSPAATGFFNYFEFIE